MRFLVVACDCVALLPQRGDIGFLLAQAPTKRRRAHVTALCRTVLRMNVGTVKTKAETLESEQQGQRKEAESRRARSERRRLTLESDFGASLPRTTQEEAKETTVATGQREQGSIERRCRDSQMA